MINNFCTSSEIIFIAIRFIYFPRSCTGGAEYTDATREFDSLVIKAAESNNIPRLTEGKVAELLAVLSDNNRFLNGTSYDTKNMNELMEICGQENAVSMKYALFGLNDVVDPKADQNMIADRINIIMEKNIMTFLNELELMQPFLIRCFAKQSSLLSIFLQTLKPEEIIEVRLNGIKMTRSGAFNMYAGFIRQIGLEGLHESFRMKILKALSETAELYSAILQPVARKNICDIAKFTQSSSPKSFQGDLQKIIAAMSATTCEGLCKF